MNGSLIITYVIGGLFLISILTFNIQVMNTSSEFALSTYNQANLDNLIEILDNDFNRIGFNTGTAVPFTIITAQNIIFQSDVYDNDSFGSTNVRWYFDKADAASNTSNPNDYYLKRTGPVGSNTIGTIEFPVTYFNLTYYTAEGTITSDRSSVKKIEVEIILESGEPYKVSDQLEQYPRLVWKRIFVPNNINLPY